MTAKEVSNGVWFMCNRTHKWYRKLDTGNMYTNATQIGDKKIHMISNDEPVMVRK